MARILVTGGAGYVGSIVVARLASAGHDVVVFDNLSTGHRHAARAALIVGDLADSTVLERVFEQGRFDGVMHFASHCDVGESVQEPRKYYEDNLCHGLRLFAAMLRFDVSRLVFSG